MGITSLAKFAILLLFCVPVLWAADEAEIKRQTLNLNQKQELIGLINDKISGLRQKETSQERELRKLEVNIGTYHKQLENLEKQNKLLADKLARFIEEAKPLKTKLARQQGELAKHLRLRYYLGKQDIMRILFNQLGNSKRIRSLAFQKYIQKKHIDLLNAYHTAWQEAENKQQAIKKQTTAINDNISQKQSASEKLQQDISQRKQLLTALKLKLKDHEYSLSKRKADARDLQDLIKKLEVSLGSLPIEVKPDAEFKKLKGRLPRPVSSKKITRAKGLKGVLFHITPGAKVRAVAGGRVVFADWLRGYGLLVILDHGAGYMSLYGRNQSLYREKGEWVQEGDLLARVGDTGGVKKSGLYFDIRLQGKSLPVLAWL